MANAQSRAPPSSPVAAGASIESKRGLDRPGHRRSLVALPHFTAAVRLGCAASKAGLRLGGKAFFLSTGNDVSVQVRPTGRESGRLVLASPIQSNACFLWQLCQTADHVSPRSIMAARNFPPPPQRRREHIV